MTSETARHEVAALINRLDAMGLASSKAGTISVRTDDGFPINPSRTPADRRASDRIRELREVYLSR